MEKFNNKTIIITGAGSGMGKSMAIKFAENGANVFATDVREDRLKELESIITKQGGKVKTKTIDVSSELAVKQMVKDCIAEFGTIEVLINNAGILDDFMPVTEASTDLWNKVMGVNLNGPFFACREAIPFMQKQGKGVIINIASIGGFCGSRAGVAYTSSKHALIGLTRNIGYQYALNGIRCNAIAPGGVNTNIGDNMHPNAFGYQKLNLGLQSNPRTADPNEIATIALFLASDESSFINGSVITADGGWTAY